ncbi:ABC transporter ATP-binding protein [Halobacteriales archaeon QS_8_65_32]|jgi:oligopeptide/dipeptide ABC transporter ATP-binding protein|nr:MAG: ABC transporter ATP-binding protein [Halobacteriales archaeon QS_8_65_32]
MALLEIDNLDVRYGLDDAEAATAVRAVDDVSLAIERGETFGLVGESGCGKTTLGKSIINLLDENGVVAGGTIQFKGQDLAELSDPAIRDVRWAEIATISQSAMNGLNPVYKVGDQITEAILRHEPETGTQEADEQARELLERVGIDGARADDFAHEFSGGMKQRAVIAMAIACDPDLIIADEPTTALDVIVQDAVLQELEDLQEELGISLLIISHDISVIAETCDRVGVMYGGKLMELGPTEAVFEEPANPYTLGLRNSFPDIESTGEQLVSIPGTPPTLEDPEPGCRFRDRCPFAVAECKSEHPPLTNVEGSPGHASACYRLDALAEMRERATEEETWRR